MRNLKKVISSVAALAIVASSASAFAVTFPDVDTSASYANAVTTLTALNVINGDDNGLFNPENKVTRAEFTKMTVEALGEGNSATALTTSQFADAANTTQHWAAGYIQQGVTDGFINGYDDTTFGPDDQVTYAQALKMLVASVGYTTYAENQGGYPSGYTAQASSLGISSGVSATNDTQLTRGQVATLIYNAMQVPLCTIDGWETVSSGFTTTQVPTLKKLDGKEGRDYQTLLTDKHDAYVVKGRVMANSQSGNVDKDKVKYDVEVSDNYDDNLAISKSNNNAMTGQEMLVGETKASDMLFEYTEAIVQKDEDSDDITILSITQYGNSKTVEFKPDDVDEDDTTNKKLAVSKNSTSSATTKYDLEDDAKVYVNGAEYGKFADLKDSEKAAIFYNNSTGSVTIVDKTETGSTSTNGYYDYIMVSYYVDAVVDSVATTNSSAKIYFKDSTSGAMSMKWDPDNTDLDMTITKDGKAINYTDLAEYDVLSIAINVNGDITTKDLNDLDYYKILAATNTVSGTVTSRVSDSDDNYVTVGGADYDMAGSKLATDLDLSTEYTLYLDAFGYVAYYDEGNSDKNYGVIVSMYTSAGNDYATVRMITADAQVVAYECKDETAQNDFFKIFTGKTTSYDGGTYSKTAQEDRIKAGDTVVQYTLSSNKIRLKGTGAEPTYGAGKTLTYKASTTKLGGYTLNEAVTKLVDIDSYLAGSDSTVSTLAISGLEDDADYKGFMVGKNNNGDYRLGVIYGGTSSLRDDATLAMVQKFNGTKDVDGTNCNEYYVVRNGQENVSVLFDEDINLNEGDIISYVIGNDGYVDDKLVIVYNAKSDYNTLRADMTTASSAPDEFSANLVGANFEMAGTDKVHAKDNGGYTSISTSKLSYIYYGPVYKKSNNSLELFSTKTNGMSDVTATTGLSVAGANQYVYNYDSKSKYRVTLGTANQNSTIFPTSTSTLWGDKDNNELLWSGVLSEDIQPAFAIAKEVDGDIVDVFYFIAE